MSGTPHRAPLGCPTGKRGDIAPGLVTVTLRRGEATVIIEGVPADGCGRRGAHYLAEGVTRRVRVLAEDAVGKGTRLGCCAMRREWASGRALRMGAASVREVGHGG